MDFEHAMKLVRRGVNMRRKIWGRLTYLAMENKKIVVVTPKGGLRCPNDTYTATPNDKVAVDWELLK